MAAFTEPTTHVTEIVNGCSVSTLQTRQFKHAQQFQFDENKDQCLLYLSDLFVGVDVWKESDSHRSKIVENREPAAIAVNTSLLSKFAGGLPHTVHDYI